MDLRDYANLIRRHWRPIIATTVIGAAVATGYSLLQAPQYESTAKVFVSTDVASTTQDLSQGSTFTQEAVAGYADVAVTPYVLDAVIDEVGLNTTAATLAKQVAVSAPTNTAMLEITVTDRSPQEAAAIANSVTKNLSSAVSKLSPTADAATASVRITQIQPALPVTSPVSPSYPRNIAIGAIAGLVLAILAMLLFEILDTRIRRVSDVQAVTPRPILGTVAFDGSAKKASPLIVQEGQRSPRAEAYRALRTNLEFLNLQSSGGTMVVTSSVASEGKSTSVANLALAIAATDQTVLVVDADLRRPRVADYFGVDGTLGLTDVLINKSNLDEAIQQWGDSRLSLLPAGRIPPNPGEVLQSPAMHDLVGTLSERFDYVIFDAPPLLPVLDAAVLARLTDGAIVIAAARRTKKPQLAVALSHLEQAEASVLGIVVTMLASKGVDAYGYGYGYGYGHHDDGPGSDGQSVRATPAAPASAAAR